MIVKTLLSRLDERFSHDTLKGIEVITSKYLANPDLDAVSRVVAFTIDGVCFSVAEYIEDMQPISESFHQQLEGTLSGRLRRAIHCLDTEDPARNDAFDVLSELIISANTIILRTPL